MASILRAEEFDALMRHLAPDRDGAGVRYEQLRLRLLAVFTYRGCANPEDLADETMDRVARRLAERPEEFEGDDPTAFILGVAWNVARESFRRSRTVSLPEDWDPAEPVDDANAAEAEQDQRECLEHCLATLPLKHRNLLLQYYSEDKRARITGRLMLARGLAVSPNALRLKVHRLAIVLRTCAFDCVRSKQRELPGGTAGAVYH